MYFFRHTPLYGLICSLRYFLSPDNTRRIYLPSAFSNISYSSIRSLRYARTSLIVILFEIIFRSVILCEIHNLFYSGLMSVYLQSDSSYINFVRNISSCGCWRGPNRHAAARKAERNTTRVCSASNIAHFSVHK